MAYIICSEPKYFGTNRYAMGRSIPGNHYRLYCWYPLLWACFANVPYGLAPGMGLNAFFTFTVVKVLVFTWQEAMSMVFICGIINIIITATSLRKMIIKSIPPMLQHAIGGIGIFIAYVGFAQY